MGELLKAFFQGEVASSLVTCMSKCLCKTWATLSLNTALTQPQNSIPACRMKVCKHTPQQPEMVVRLPMNPTLFRTVL